MKNWIDRSEFEEYGGIVRWRLRLEENRGLAFVDRIKCRETCVLDGCRRGRANDSRSRRKTGRFRGQGAGGLPGPGSFQNALGEREESYRTVAVGAASSVQDVNRCTAVVSDSPRRRSVGHASRSQIRDREGARENSAASLRPPLGPAPSEARGTPAASVTQAPAPRARCRRDSPPRPIAISFICRSPRAATSRAVRRPIVQLQAPRASREAPFLWYSPKARRGAAARWVGERRWNAER